MPTMLYTAWSSRDRKKRKIKLSTQSKSIYSYFMSCACVRNSVAMIKLVFHSIQTKFTWKDPIDTKDHFFRTAMQSS